MIETEYMTKLFGTKDFAQFVIQNQIEDEIHLI